jgi:magnesium-protoporphyrin O-methyltransferase
VLDIGGGVGAISHRLLNAGAQAAVGVDASRAYVEVAQEEAERLGLSESIRIEHGNFVDMAQGVEPADVVTLDKVICCFDDVEKLIRLSAERAGRLYGLVYPRYNWISRVFFAASNLYLRLRRSHFRVFVRPTQAVDALVRKSGLRPLASKQTLVWHVELYTR